MKMIKTCAVALAMLATVPAMAQFGGGASSGSTGDNENYQRVELGYNAEMLTGTTLSGFTANYNYGLSLSQDLPLYLEFGGRLSYNGGNDISLLGLTIPVSVGYKFNVTDNIAITPYTGINFRINLLAKANGHSLFGGDDNDSGDWEDEDWGDWGDYSSRSYIDDILNGDFDPDDFIEDAIDDAYASSKWKRFQMGWQIGAGVNFGKWYAGLEYGLDFIKIADHVNSSHLNISVGYTF